MNQSIRNCIARLTANKKISKEQGEKAQKIADSIYQRLVDELGPVGAEAQAATQTAKLLAEAAGAKKATAVKNAIALETNRTAMLSHPKDVGAGLNAILTRDVHDVAGNSVQSASETLTDKLLSKINDAFENYTSRNAGLSAPRSDIRNVVLELFGRDTGDQAAKTLAAGWGDAVKYAVERAKGAGKQFQDLETWRLPQFWEPSRLKAAGRDAWVADVRAAIARDDLKVYDKESGAELVEGGEPNIVEALGNIWTKIVVDEGKGVASPFNAFRRSFHFQNADAWLRFNGSYGIQSADLFSTMVGHLKGMANEIALMERLGPNYRATFEALRAEASSRIATGASKKSNPFTMDGLGTAENSFKMLTGDANAVKSEAVAGFMGGVRALLSAAQLGSAVAIAIPTDSFTTLSTAIFNGLPAFKVLSRGFWDLFTDNAEKRAFAARLGFVSHSLQDASVAAFRYADVDGAPKLMSALASTVQRATGMDRWTNVMKRAFTMEMLGHLSEQSVKGFDAIDERLRETLTRYGIGKKDWALIRKAQHLTHDGARFLDLESISDPIVAEKLSNMIIDERKFAILEPDARVRGFTTQGQARGTAGGEIVRSLLQYKAFPLTMMMTHVRRLANQQGFGSKIAYGLPFVVGMTLAGAVGLQTREIIKGKDPRNMSMTPDNAAFWAQAFITGGAVGVWGDLINSAVSRTGQTSAVLNMVGPVAGLAEDTLKLTGIGARGAIDGDISTFGARGAQYIKRYTPGSTIWYARTALDRLLWDNVQALVDPNYRQSFQRMMARAKQDQGQDFFWRPGSMTPDRGPDFGAAFGQ